MKIQEIKLNNRTIAYKIDNEINFLPPYFLLEETALYIKDLLKTLNGIELQDPIKPNRICFMLEDGTTLKFTGMDYLAYRYLVEYLIKRKTITDYHEELLLNEIKERKQKDLTILPSLE